MTHLRGNAPIQRTRSAFRNRPSTHDITKSLKCSCGSGAQTEVLGTTAVYARKSKAPPARTLGPRFQRSAAPPVRTDRHPQAGPPQQSLGARPARGPSRRRGARRRESPAARLGGRSPPRPGSFGSPSAPLRGERETPSRPTPRLAPQPTAAGSSQPPLRTQHRLAGVCGRSAPSGWRPNRWTVPWARSQKALIGGSLDEQRFSLVRP